MKNASKSGTGSSSHRNGLVPARGFTLIELMIVVLIVAILTTIAVPLYQEAVRHSRRSAAKTALLELASREARYYSANNVYTDDTTTKLGYGAASPVPVPDAAKKYYLMSVTLDTATHLYTATAVPQGPQAHDTCGTYTLNSYGVKGNTGNSTATGDCWN